MMLPHSQLQKFGDRETESSKVRERKSNAETRKNVKWAWEFLRRNEDYRKCYANWSDRKNKNDQAFSPVELARINNALIELGWWRPRYEPWVRAGLESGKRFINWTVEAGSAREIATADRSLDPMAFMLNRWVDPSLSLLPHDLQIFDLAATLDYEIVTLGCREYRALSDLGQLQMTPFDEVSETFGGYEVVTSNRMFGMNIAFETEKPLAPQILQAVKLLTRLQLGVRSTFHDLNRELAGLKILDRGGIYTEFLRLIDAVDEYPTQAKAFRVVSGDKTLNPKDTEYRRLEKAYETAKYLRDVGYSALAFHAESKMVNRLLKWSEKTA